MFRSLTLLFWLASAVRAGGAQADPAPLVEGLERRYAAARSVAGEFRQTYRAPGIERTESGTFAMMQPGLMRWEYRHPEQKLFVADGREAFLYLPEEGQVQVHSLRPSDLHNTPLQFLVGRTEIRRNFVVRPDDRFTARFPGSALLRLTPRAGVAEYAFLVLECEPGTSDLRRIIIVEHTGNTSEFEFHDLRINAPVEKSMFRFRIPKGVDIVRLDEK